MLEKEIEEGKRNKYEYLNEADNNLNNNINLTDMNNNFEYKKQYFLESLYKEEKAKKNRSAKKNNSNNDYSSTKMTQRNMKDKINNYKYIPDNNRNKTPSNIRKNTKKKK